jgi:hypothetical protein
MRIQGRAKEVRLVVDGMEQRGSGEIEAEISPDRNVVFTKIALPPGIRSALKAVEPCTSGHLAVPSVRECDARIARIIKDEVVDSGSDVIFQGTLTLEGEKMMFHLPLSSLRSKFKAADLAGGR